MKLRKTLAGILGAVVMLLGVGTFEHINKETGVKAASGKYVKVTTNPDDWTGDYLIVYETSKHCLNGSLSTIDAKNNYASVTISNNAIESTSAVDNYKFTIASTDGGYTILSANKNYYIGSNSTSNALSSSTSTKYVNTISLNSDGSAHIVGSKKSVLRYNTSEKRFRYYKESTYSGQAKVHLYRFEGVVEEHTCTNFVEEENPSKLASPATCTSAAYYYKVCSECRIENTELTYQYGEPLEHNYDELGLCTGCGNYNEDLSLDDRVTKLFAKYFNDGNYTKETYLNVNPTAMKEVGTYFHAEAIAPYRKTVYEPGKLSMVTANVKGEYNNDTLSVYENNSDEGNVKHTGLGGNWEVNWPSVEEKFVTLKDFKESTITGWTYENGIYSYTLTPATATTEDDMTRMAREFVAPMWLAPNADNYNYVSFTKLTVEEDGAELVMKLFVSKDNAGKLIDQTECLFSQARISKGTTNLATLATFEFGENGNGGNHVDGSTDSKTYSETNNGYTLSISDGSKMYANSFDKIGNACIKFGSNSNAGKFSFTVPEDVNKVIIYVSGYKGNTAKVKVNGTNYDIDVLSDNGEYFAIEVNTKETKSVNVESLNGGYRFMLNTIEFHS